MQSLSDDERKLVFGEVLANELKIIHEYVKDIPDINRRLVRVETGVYELKSDMKAVKAAITDQGRQIKALSW